ncbi:hypothetical protein [Massilia luteola]|uniref:hypothetical protein n=1 Tax=Massilia luteola TaxID=3081751 RepID=UPI003133ADA0
MFLARTSYKNPKILVLDEVTSHLDVFDESKVDVGLREMKLTGIMVPPRSEQYWSGGRSYRCSGRQSDCRIRVRTRAGSEMAE